MIIDIDKMKEFRDHLRSEVDDCDCEITHSYRDKYVELLEDILNSIDQLIKEEES